MNKQQKLKKIIEYATKRGWKGWNKDWHIMHINPGGSIQIVIQDEKKPEDYDYSSIHSYSFLFSHDFAKAVFGKIDEWYITDCDCGGIDFHLGGHDAHKDGCARVKADRGYEFHLKEAVISKDRIDYYFNFIEKGKK